MTLMPLSPVAVNARRTSSSPASRRPASARGLPPHVWRSLVRLVEEVRRGRRFTGELQLVGGAIGGQAAVAIGWLDAEQMPHEEVVAQIREVGTAHAVAAAGVDHEIERLAGGDERIHYLQRR